MIEKIFLLLLLFSLLFDAQSQNVSATAENVSAIAEKGLSRTTNANCGIGESVSLSNQQSWRCCSPNAVKGFDYEIQNVGSHDFTAKVELFSGSSTYLSDSRCKVTNEGKSCEGAPCIFSSNGFANDCKSDQCCWSGSSINKYCLHIYCDEWHIFGSNCEFSSVKINFDTVSVSSPPPSSSCSTHSSCSQNQYCDGNKNCYPCTSYFYFGGLADTYNGITEGCTYLTRPSPPPAPSLPPSFLTLPCPTSSSQCSTFCTNSGYSNGASWSSSYSSGSGGSSSCLCYTSSGTSTVRPSCTASSPAPAPTSTTSPPPPPSPPPWRLPPFSTSSYNTPSSTPTRAAGKIAGIVAGVVSSVLVCFIRLIYAYCWKKPNTEQVDVVTTVVVHQPDAENGQTAASPEAAPKASEQEEKNKKSHTVPNVENPSLSSVVVSTTAFDTKFCSACGHAISDAAFCAACGQKVQR